MLQNRSFSKTVKLHYVTDENPGITRKRHGKYFVYFDPQGRKVVDQKLLGRIKSLGIPPAYENVWICPFEKGHLQATGTDSRGRKQYIYHSSWRQEREANKFEHILYFGEKLPLIRAKVEEDMKEPPMTQKRVMATVVQLLEKTLIRVGNSEYARQNGSYGLTTLRRKHVRVQGSGITFRFKGKSGKEWNLSLNDRRIASVIKHCEEIPGQELFKYIADDGKVIDVTSSDVNGYLQDISGEQFTAKDFRTWSATVLAALALREFEAFDSQAQAKKNIVGAIERVAKQLGNTPTICRKSYIHPEVINAYMDGDFVNMIERQIEEKLLAKYKSLSTEEIMVLVFLRKRLTKSKK